VLPGVVMPFDTSVTEDLWRYTAVGARQLFSNHFAASLETAYVGNVLTAMAALHRLPASSLTEDEFGPADLQHQLLVTVRAVRT